VNALEHIRNTRPNHDELRWRCLRVILHLPKYTVEQLPDRWQVSTLGLLDEGLGNGAKVVLADGLKQRLSQTRNALHARFAAEGALCRGFFMVSCIVPSSPRRVSQKTVQRTEGKGSR